MNLLDVRNLCVRYGSEQTGVLAVDTVDLRIGQGEFVGLAGESGCGKTTLAMAIPNLLPEGATVVSGSVTFDGQDITHASEETLNSIRWKEISVIFQGALNALNPVKSVGWQIAEPMLAHDSGLSDKDALARARELLDAVGISKSRSSAYPHEFSGGMRQRVMIAMALACKPKLVIADEPITALDVMTQAQILDLLRSLSSSFDLSLLLISHDLSVLADTCDRVQVMYAGKAVESGSAETIFASADSSESAAHPYTNRLLKSYPNILHERVFIDGIPGYPPDLSLPQTGCRFAARCDQVQSVCRTQEPALIELHTNHFVACHFAEQVSR